MMVCLSVGMKIFDYKDYLNPSDHFAIFNQMVVMLIMTFFIGLITYFSCSIVPKLYLVHHEKKYEQYGKTMSQVRANFKAKEEEKLELNKWRPEEVQILPRSRAELFPSTMLLASPMHTWLASSKAEAGKETEDKKEEEAMDTSSNMESATTSIKKELTLDEE